MNLFLLNLKPGGAPAPTCFWNLGLTYPSYSAVLTSGCRSYVDVPRRLAYDYGAAFTYEVAQASGGKRGAVADGQCAIDECLQTYGDAGSI